jgi:hypothetical protein
MAEQAPEDATAALPDGALSRESGGSSVNGNNVRYNPDGAYVRARALCRALHHTVKEGAVRPRWRIGALLRWRCGTPRQHAAVLHTLAATLSAQRRSAQRTRCACSHAVSSKHETDASMLTCVFSLRHRLAQMCASTT